MLYLLDFFVGLVDTRSYYILGDKAGMGYYVSLCTTLLDLVLIIIIINETRRAPSKPIITETVSKDIYIRRKIGF
jgi:hypothetical protein